MVGPVPWELAAGLGAHVAAFTGIGKEYAPYLHAFGLGAINSFLHSFGRGLGRKARKAAGLPPVAETLLSGEDEGDADGRGGAVGRGTGEAGPPDLSRPVERPSITTRVKGQPGSEVARPSEEK